MKKNITLNSNSSIFLLGMMGSGKTSLGKKLAKLIGYDFLDLDNYICKKTNVSINLIFEYEGEPGFRKRENKALKEIIDTPKTIIATGGGVVQLKENRDLLTDKYCLFLNSSIQRILEKTRKSQKRPLLNNLNFSEKRAVIENLFKQRHPHYSKLATHTIIPMGDDRMILEQMKKVIDQDLT